MGEVPGKETSAEQKAGTPSAADGAQARIRQFEIAYPETLKTRENNLLGKRQGNLPGVPGEPTVGFGLSGGGIRSATFCLGLFQSLAKKDLLNKVDFLSSVSGGGFFASFYGRLFARPDVQGFDDIRKILSPDQDRQLDFPAQTKNGQPVASWKS